MEVEKKKKVVRTVAERLQVIHEIESGKKIKDVCEKFNMQQSTASTIYKNREALKRRAQECPTSLKQKKPRSCKSPEVEAAVVMFIQEARAQNIPLSGPIIQAKAKCFAQSMAVENFEASSGWLTKFNKRNGFSYKSICGESKAVDMTVANDWMEKILPDLIKDYDPVNIFNADETGLFFKCLPEKTYTYTDNKCHGGKHSKERITVMVGANMDGTEKLKLLVIGKSQNPRAMKNVKKESLPVSYEANRKAWMIGDVYRRWRLQLDQKFSAENRKVLLILDNCSAHPKSAQAELNLKSIQIAFFPPNMTSVVQPMDLGIIKSLKHHYRHELVLKRLEQMEQKKPLVDVNILDAINIISKVWEMKVTEQTIANCFRKAGFSGANQSADTDPGTIDEADPTMDTSHADFEALKQQLPNMVGNFEEYATIDDGVEFCGRLTDEEILEIVTSSAKEHEDTENVLDESHESADVTVEKPSQTEVKNAVETVLRALQMTANVPEKMHSHLYKIEHHLLQNF